MVKNNITVYQKVWIKAMKTLLLIRHSNSDWVADNDNDFQRPLNKQGEVVADFMGNYLFEKNIVPDAMISSAAVRALTTANILASKMKFSVDNIIIDDKLYLAEPQTFRHQVEAFDDQNDTVIVVGHNPGITNFAGYLTAEHVGNMPPCGIYAVQMNIDTWRAIGSGCATSLFFEIPRSIKV